MNMKKQLSLIKVNNLFKDISTDQLIDYFHSGSFIISDYNKNNMIHFEGEKCQTLDLILKGEARVQRIDEQGNILTITDFSFGDSIGGNILFSKYPHYPMTIISKTNCTILHIKKSLVLNLCQSNETFLLEFLTCISDITTILTDKIKTISLKSIRESVIDFLKYEYYIQKSCRIILSMTKKELAERLGIQRTSLSRELNKMRKDGLIDFNADSITIIGLEF
ncbi:Crp/Fnr family transcriptional regulator [Alkaliphilus hydrothermalis]|uniref:CRP-like cAMP-binding protein n=1 Tax=Alkaliphilus hydrothermalis TaxID=1482730 RepID=A0ABS2NRR0_9FIRM|nr:Crp/Fnr family transcriptional regulator [Alkaliphilus hydrothermalis]MBM7615567.1 CRP-like cAMP-binding protein [Alkaliphilus hydrothermalis]